MTATDTPAHDAQAPDAIGRLERGTDSDGAVRCSGCRDLWVEPDEIPAGAPVYYGPTPPLGGARHPYCRPCAMRIEAERKALDDVLGVEPRDDPYGKTKADCAPRFAAPGPFRGLPVIPDDKP